MSEIINQKTEAESVAAIVKASLVPTFSADRRGVIVMPNGMKINLEDERFADNPKRQRALVSLYETHSFIEYVNAHKVAGVTHVFGEATEEGGQFLAILDFHKVAGADSVPGWGEHLCSLTLATTPEWRRWLAGNGKLMPQEAFAEFIEDNLADIVQPDAATLIDTAQLLQGKKSVTFKSGKNLKNGAITLEYTEQIEATGGRTNDTLSVPDSFVLGLCPFVGADGVQVKARLRFRIGNDGKVFFAYTLDRPFKVIEEAFGFARVNIEAKTSLGVHLGTAKVVPSTAS